MEVGGRRRPTLLQHMTSLDSSNLRDLLRARDDENDGRHTLAGLTLAAVLSGENRRGPTRTLLDIIREEESGTAHGGLVLRHDDNNNNKKSWKSFRERLRIRRDGSNWPSSSTASTHRISVDECQIQISSPISSSRNTGNSVPIAPSTPPGAATVAGDEIPVVIPPESVAGVDAAAPIVEEFRPSEPALLRLSAALEAEREEQRQARESHVADEEEMASPVPVSATETAVDGPRVSLMALLEETDRQREAARASEEEEEEEGKGDVAEGAEEREIREYVCCVCMVRHKGAAFIPCGHTFCRLCSRELWVSRGNCPLCNGYILEILDIF